MKNVILTISILLSGVLSFAQKEEGPRYAITFNNTTHSPKSKLGQYKSFDFEFISKDNPAMEKQLTDILQSKLEQNGLIRDREHPGLLVFIGFYSGDDKKYVPPTSTVTTRYGNKYNIWTGGSNKSSIKSKLSGRYTQTTYRYSYKVRMLDAKKAKANAPTPPIIWQAEQEGVSGTKTDLLELAPAVYEQMIRRNP